MIKACEFHYCDHLSKSVPAESFQETGKKAFYFHQHQVPCLYLNWFIRENCLLSRCQPLSNDKTIATSALPIDRPRQMSMKPLIWLKWPSNPKAAAALLPKSSPGLWYHDAQNRSLHTLKCWGWPALKHDGGLQMLSWSQLIWLREWVRTGGRKEGEGPPHWTLAIERLPQERCLC